MKKLIIPTILCLTINASAQFYFLSTNLYQTNSIAASATLTSTVTNYLDVRRYSSIGIVAVWSGSDTNTNSIAWTFQGSPDSTNWDTFPRWSLLGTNYGTNRVIASTNVSIIDAGFIRPYQAINNCTNSLTNVTVYGLIKEFPRN